MVSLTLFSKRRCSLCRSLPITLGCAALAIAVVSIGDSLFLTGIPDNRCKGCGRYMELVSSFENLGGRLERFRCACGREGTMTTLADGQPQWREWGPEDKAQPE